MYVGMLVIRVQVTYSGDVQFEDPTHVCGYAGEEGVGHSSGDVQFEDLIHVCGNACEEGVDYLQRRCPV